LQHLFIPIKNIPRQYVISVDNSGWFFLDTTKHSVISHRVVRDKHK